MLLSWEQEKAEVSPKQISATKETLEELLKIPFYEVIRLQMAALLPLFYRFKTKKCFFLPMPTLALHLHRVYYRHLHNWNFLFSFLLRSAFLFRNKFRLSFAYLFHIIEIFFTPNSFFIFNKIGYANKRDSQILRFEILFILYSISITHSIDFAKDINSQRRLANLFNNSFVQKVFFCKTERGSAEILHNGYHLFSIGFGAVNPDIHIAGETRLSVEG